MTDQAKTHVGPFIYVWMAVSLLMNISGMAGIVDGFVTWVGFFRDFVGVYKALIREPLSGLAHLVWPTNWPRIPTWVFDCIVIWSGFFLALNLSALRYRGTTLFGWAVEKAKPAEAQVLINLFRLGFLLFVFILGPLSFIILLPRFTKERDEADKNAPVSIRTGVITTYVYFGCLVATMVLIMFLNWQLQKAGIRT